MLSSCSRMESFCPQHSGHSAVLHVIMIVMPFNTKQGERILSPGHLTTVTGKVSTHRSLAGQV